jgi:hypothetical protein
MVKRHALAACAVLAVGVYASVSRAAPGLATAALSNSTFPGSVVGSAFCNGSCAQGYGTQSDIANAGPGVVAIYERLLSYPETASRPLFAFVDEELFSMKDTASAAAKFGRLQKEGNLAALGPAFSNLYLETVALPVRMKTATTTKLSLGDRAFELLLSGASKCCHFQAAAVVTRVDSVEAVLFVGGAAAQLAPGVLTRIEHAAIAAVKAYAHH